MSNLQDDLKKYDEKYWDLYDEPKIDTIHHIVGHLNKLLGKIGEYTDVHDHVNKADQAKLENEVIPDLLAHGYRLAYMFNVDAEDLFEKRLVQLRKHFDSKGKDSE